MIGFGDWLNFHCQMSTGLLVGVRGLCAYCSTIAILVHFALWHYADYRWCRKIHCAISPVLNNHELSCFDEPRLCFSRIINFFGLKWCFVTWDVTTMSVFTSYKDRFLTSLPASRRATADFTRPVFLAVAFYLCAKKQKVFVLMFFYIYLLPPVVQWAITS